MISTSTLVVGIAASACGPTDSWDTSGLEQPTEYRPAISDGYEDTEDSAIVSVVDTRSLRLCTGTLLANNLVLTARHCVSDISSGGLVDCETTTFTSPASPQDFVVSTKAEVTSDYIGNTVSMVLTPDASDAFCGFDIAMLILAEPIRQTEAVPVAARLDDAPEVGETFSAVGFGAIDDDGNGNGLRRRRDDIAVICLGEACPGGTVASPEVTDAEFVGDQGVCIGDSGGPAIDAMGRVMGVTSRGLSGCSRPAYSSTFSWASWIRDAGVIAAGAGQYTPPAWTTGSELDPTKYAPVGEPCDDDLDCYSGVCMNSLNGPQCTRHCDERAACPEGYQCAKGGDVCVLDPASSKYPRRRQQDDCGVGRVGASSSGSGASLVLVGLLWGFRRRRRAFATRLIGRTMSDLRS